VDKYYNFEEFCGIIKQLRSEQGCPWDREQTHASLKQCLIEEAYEVLEGIDEYDKTKDFDNLREELGDVLLQVVMHSIIAKEEGIFTIEEVIDEIAQKMVRRHPHVFGDVLVDSSEGVIRNWEEIKKLEKKAKQQKDGLEAIPKAFPALIRAQKVVKKSNKMYGEEAIWTDSEWKKEISYLVAEEQERKRQEETMGKVLFELCKVAQKQQLNAEECLSEYVKNFIEKQ
jgi:tetrapyrrole methylase family protein/MazG family protein